jgi:curved DNA-binding protein CbpA
MVETVKLRPNHYETLGLTPAASSEEIAQAFAREVNLIALRPLGTFARVSAAYEALRDPVRRLAYDASLAPPPRPSHSLIGRLERAPIEDRPPAKASGAQPLPPSVEPDVLPASEPIAASLVDEPLRQSPEALATDSQRQQWSEPPPDQYFADQVDWRELEREARADRSMRPAVRGLVINTAVGGALLLAIVLGAWTGLESGNDNQQAQRVLTVDLPISLATTAPATDATAAPASTSSEEEVERPREAPQVAARTQPARPPLQIDLPDEVPAQPAPADEASERPSGELAGEPAEPASRTAKLPLPDAVVARTIGRIGYACGQVASTVPMDGKAPGTFKVTCTSGDSYRAAPVNGRYRFRRLGGR